jgi:biotin operon repressor
MITVVDNTLTAIKSEIKRLRALGYKVTEVEIDFGLIVYEEGGV